MTSHVTQRTAANGAAMAVPGVFPAEYQAPPTRRSLAAQVAAMLAMLTGVWVAISPWFLALQVPAGSNAMAVDLIAGLAVAALGLFAICGARGFWGLQAASALLGIWLVIVGAPTYRSSSTADPEGGRQVFDGEPPLHEQDVQQVCDTLREALAVVC
jgi:hypothetical protein